MILLYCKCFWLCQHVNFVKFGSLCKVCLCLSGVGQCIWFMSAFLRLSRRLSWLNYSPLFIHMVRYGANSCTVSKIFLLPPALTWRYQTLKGYVAPYESSFEEAMNKADTLPEIPAPKLAVKNQVTNRRCQYVFL